MDLWQLHIFCKVIEQKSFSKAGKLVHLSQPTVSSHIKDLENHFGCRLIDRLARKALPTKAGQLLYKHARQLLDLRDATESAMAEFQGQIKGRLIIGGSTIPGTYILPCLIGMFTRRYPDVTIALVIGDTAEIIAATLDGRLEIGLVGAQAHDSRLVQEKLMDDKMRLIVPAEHPWANRKQVKLKDLLKEAFIIREAGSGTLKSVQMQLARKGFQVEDLKIAAEMGSTEAVIQAIKHRVGLSIVSTIAVRDELADGRLKALKVESLQLKRNFFLTQNRYRSASPLGRAFCEYLKTEVNHCKIASAPAPRP